MPSCATSPTSTTTTMRRSAHWTMPAGAAWASPATSATPTTRTAAEIAVTVVDDWQGRGLGTELLTRLSSRARAEGIHRFTALVAQDNMAMAGLLRHMSASLAGRSPGTVDYEVTLMPPGKSTTTPAAGLRQDRVPTPC